MTTEKPTHTTVTPPPADKDVHQRESFSSRVDREAERAKRYESSAMHSARDAVDSGSRFAESAMHRATDATADAAKRAQAKADEMGERGSAAYARGRAGFDDSLDEIFVYVRNNPGKSMAIAAAGGWLLGNLLRRRRRG